jgi:virginiamycin B lyase
MRADIKVFAVAVAVTVVWLPVSLISELAGAEELDPVPIKEWPVPFGGHGRDPQAAGPDEIWFVGQQGDYLARFTPSTEEFFKVDLPDGTGPHNNVVDSDGVVWYSGNAAGEIIGAYDPKTGELGMIDVPGARDPHTLLFDVGEQHLWFTVQFGNMIGRMTLADGKIELIEVPTEGARPYGIKLAPDGAPWVVLFGTNKLARVDPQTLSLTEIELPESDARPRRLEITSDGRIWYADFARGSIGLYDPARTRFDEWALPTGPRARPYGMALDDLERVWLVETGADPNQFVGFDTGDERVFSITEIPSGGRAVRNMDFEPTSGTVWFGTDNDTLGRATVKAN